MILERKHEYEWLDPDLSFNGAIDLITPYPSNDLQSFVVSQKVNKAGFNSPELIKEKKSSLSKFL